MPPTIKRSGTKVTVKIVTTLTNLLGSVRSTKISPQKRMQNPPHAHVNVPKSVRPKP